MGKSLGETIQYLRQKKRSTTFRDLVSMMESLGCGTRKTQHGCVVSHLAITDYRATVARPHGSRQGKHVKVPYVNNCIRLLCMLEEREE